MTEHEYLYLIDQNDSMTKDEYQDAGLTCFEEGWIDVFGFVTPKGEKAREEYENESSTS